MDVAKLVADFGFPVVAVVGLGYFMYMVRGRGTIP